MTSPRSNLATNWLRLAVLAISLATLSFGPIVQRATLARVALAGNQSPAQEERQEAEEELVTWSEERDRLKQRKFVGQLRPGRIANNFRPWRLFTAAPHAAEGHRLANGICAPLLT